MYNNYLEVFGNPTRLRSGCFEINYGRSATLILCVIIPQWLEFPNQNPNVCTCTQDPPRTLDFSADDCLMSLSFSLLLESGPCILTPFSSFIAPGNDSKSTVQKDSSNKLLIPVSMKFLLPLKFFSPTLRLLPFTHAIKCLHLSRLPSNWAPLTMLVCFTPFFDDSQHVHSQFDFELVYNFLYQITMLLPMLWTPCTV